jgi:membrane associated rhomboid family serine protease
MSQISEDALARKPAINAPPIVLASIAVLVAIHLILWWLGENWQIWSLYSLSFIPLRLGGGPLIPAPPGAQIWTFLTYALLHADYLHLLFNCIWLLIFGTPVARYCGAWRYLAIAAIAAAGGAAATLALYWGEFLTLIGASGAISGLLGAAIPIMYGRRSALTFAELIGNGRALVFMLVWLAATLATGAAGVGGTPYMGMNIAWEAHIGGFLAGLAAFFAITPATSRWKDV